MPADARTIYEKCPVEIWITILRIATQGARPTPYNAFVINSWDRAAAAQQQAAIKHILRLATVSRTWHAMVQPFLFEWIHTRNARGHNPYQLSKYLQKDVNGRRCGTYVKRLTFQMYGPEWLDKRQGCLALLSQCTQLEEFECESPIMMTMRGGGHDVGFDLVRILLDTCRNTLRRVHVGGKQMHPVHFYAQVLTQCPRLESLDCACWNLDGWSLQMTLSTDSSTTDLPLRSFTWVTGHEAFMQFFSNLPLRHLRKVYIADESTGWMLGPNDLLPEVERFFQMHGSRLLHVELSDGIWLLDRKKGMAAAILAHCPNLEEFAFNLYACQSEGLPQKHEHLKRVSCCQLRLPPSSPDMKVHLRNVQQTIVTLSGYPNLERIRCTDIPHTHTTSTPDPMDESYSYRKFTKNIAILCGSQGIRFEDKEGHHMVDGQLAPRRRG